MPTCGRLRLDIFWFGFETTRGSFWLEPPVFSPGLGCGVALERAGDPADRVVGGGGEAPLAALLPQQLERVLQHGQGARLAGDVGDDALDEAGVEVDADGARGLGGGGAQLRGAELGDEDAVPGVVGDLVEAQVAGEVEDDLAAVADAVDAQGDDDDDGERGVAGEGPQQAHEGEARGGVAVGEQRLERVDDDEQGAGGVGAVPVGEGAAGPVGVGGRVDLGEAGERGGEVGRGQGAGVDLDRAPAARGVGRERGHEAGEDERGLADAGRTGDDDEAGGPALAEVEDPRVQLADLAVAAEEGPGVLGAERDRTDQHGRGLEVQRRPGAKRLDVGARGAGRAAVALLQIDRRTRRGR